MRIQHNIMAMNSYRNYTSNTSALAKNLEKLSSGYKINRAGDDAAGLAISEKMRAQITGLKQAQANAKSGINLVQTAEGALTEVHDMLNRMVKLADQSANGTYDDKVDRNNLQKEVDALKTEIDRIAQASNFNGINLLDGSLGSPEVTATDGTADGTTPAVAAKYVFDFAGKSALTNGQSVRIAGKTFNAANGSGEIDVSTADTLQKQLDVIVAGLTTGGNALTGYTVSRDGDSIVITADAAGVDANAGTVGAAASWNSASVDKSAASVVGADEVTGVNTAAKTEIDFTGKIGSDMIGSKLVLGNQKFQFVEAGGTADTGYNAVELNAAADAAAIATALNGAINNNAVANFSNAADVNKVTLTETTPAGNTKAPKAEFSGVGLTLQIGDTSDSFNQLTVSVQSMKTSALGIDTVDVSTQSDAAKAVDVIKAAINTVSSVRGDLGATQNRLDHTINNLSVMTENIQDAEATIRDVDVAEEMMAYTKNNILVQSAQAMLAQANQVPQGVLQLLQ